MLYCDNELSLDGGVGSTHKHPPPIWLLCTGRCPIDLYPNVVRLTL